MEILVTEDRDTPIKREIGFVSTTTAVERAEAIDLLKEQARGLGANAIILLRAGRAFADPHFPSDIFYAHGVAVEI